jgi:hypothetical protein
MSFKKSTFESGPVGMIPPEILVELDIKFSAFQRILGLIAPSRSRMKAEGGPVTNGNEGIEKIPQKMLSLALR